MRAESLVDVVDDGNVLHVVELAAFEQVGLAQRHFHLLHAGFGHGNGALLLVDLEVALVEAGDESVDGVVEVGAIVERAGDDQRRACLVDQDRVHFVDDGVDVAALDHILHPVLHVVAQIVEAKLVIGAVGNVAGVGALALLIVHPVHDVADSQAEEAVDLAHPLGVALGEIVVDGDDVHALAGKRIEINRQRGDQRLAFAGLHLGDLAFVQDHAADELNVEVALAERPLGGFAHGGEGRHQQVVELGAVGDLLLEVLGAGLEGLVGERRDLLLQGVDLIDPRLIAANPPVIGRAEQLAGNGADHTGAPTLDWSPFITPPRPDLASGAPECGSFRAKSTRNAQVKRNQPRLTER